MRLGFIIMSQRIKLSRQWVGPGSPRPKMFKTQPSADKVMATVFWYAKGVIMLDFLPKRSTITGVYLLDQLRTAIREKRRGKLSKGVLLQQDNARVHTCKVAMDAVERNGYELIPHPAYSPDLAPSDFFLFPNMKKDIRGPFPVWWRSRDGSWGVGQWKGYWLFQFWADGTWTPLV